MPKLNKKTHRVPSFIKRHNKTILFSALAILMVSICLWFGIYKFGPKEPLPDSEEMATMMPIKPGYISQKVQMPGAEVNVAPSMNSPSVRFHTVPHCVVTTVIKNTEDENDEMEPSNYSAEEN